MCTFLLTLFLDAGKETRYLNDAGNPINYRIEEKQEGRAGWVFYLEQSRLPFPWELLGAGGGISITVPMAEAWNRYCEEHEADWAKGRREEILQRVAQSMLKQRYGIGYFTIEEQWVSVYPV